MEIQIKKYIEDMIGGVKLLVSYTEPEFLNFYGAQESIPPAYVAWRAGTTTLFLLRS
jgi:hypothetical protein